MTAHLTVLADQDRLALFTRLGESRRLFHHATTWTDENGIAWTGVRAGTTGVALTWLGPGWVFDPEARRERREEYEKRIQAMRRANPTEHRRKLASAVQQLRLGGHAERLLWAIHTAVRDSRSALLTLSDAWLAAAVWGRECTRRPLHWRGDLLRSLRGLSMLHIAAWPGETPPDFGEGTALLTHVGDLQGSEEDRCDDRCPDRDGQRHHHIQVEIGPAFLGELERFGHTDDETGIRTYLFPTGGPRSRGASLWRMGKVGRLTSVFLPAKLGEPSLCGALTTAQHRLLQILICETTRATRECRGEISRPAVLQGTHVPNYAGSKQIYCPQLKPTGEYVGFNGNGKRKGQGYRLSSEGGWLAKAGYAPTEVATFLDDLAVLGGQLDLIVVGIDRASQPLTLRDIQWLTQTPSGQRTLQSLHIRIYTDADYLERWNTLFCGEQVEMDRSPPVNQVVAELLVFMEKKKVSRRELAKGIGQDPSFFGRLLNGKKPWPSGLLQKAQRYVAARQEPRRSSPSGASHRKPKPPADCILDEALDLLDRGWSIVPQLAGEKKPCVRWKPYQDRPPTREEMTHWFKRWPAAGLALILGPVSGVFVIDVDGPEAHETLMERLGGEPNCPKAISGSDKPHRYHLYFRHPELPTKAKQTPWHPQLEFRGYRGIVIIPPSLHKSGKRYAWAPGRSLEDLELLEVPEQVRDALKPAPPVRSAKRGSGKGTISVTGIDASPRTLEFLSGRWSERPGWNDKLFQAACDLCGRGWEQDKAEPLLFAGASPWNMGEEELAQKTITSAFSQPRVPAYL